MFVFPWVENEGDPLHGLLFPKQKEHSPSKTKTIFTLNMSGRSSDSPERNFSVMVTDSCVSCKK